MFNNLISRDMQVYTYFKNKAASLLLFGFAFVGLTSCGSYDYASYEDDGIYDSDPEKNADAKKYDRITGDDVLKQRLSVMDLTAFTLCRENNTPIIVFNMNERGNFKKIVVDGADEGTTVVWE